MLFAGDGHARQGDGELNGDALETSMDVEFTVSLVRGHSKMTINRLFALLAAFLLCLVPAPAQVENSRQLFTQIEPILQDVAGITGFKMKHKVPADYISKPDLGQFLQRRIKEVVNPEEIRIESLTLKMFGFLPDDYDLKKAMIELMTEQAAAFYDYDHKRLFITESETSFLEKRAALVHELAHALADQSFHLGRFLRKRNKSDDAGTAREAVVEGQATWLMWAYASTLGGGEAKVSSFILDSMKGASDSAVGSQFPVFEKAPLYLRESLIFPYTEGLRFQDAVTSKLGKAGFTEVFVHPPVSTQQILHPEQYLAHRDPTRCDPPRIPNARRYRKIGEGSAGELDFRILLEQYAGRETALRIAPHWRGGSYRLYESKQGRNPLLAFAAEWDSADTAREFFEAYRDHVLKGKWRRLEAGERDAQHSAGSGDRGGFSVTLEGSRISVLEGLPEAR